MKTLYIIGNGFDLTHLLPTQFSQFYGFMEENYSEFFDEFLRYYASTDFGLSSGHQQKAWENFEQSLGEYNYKDLFDDCYYDYNQGLALESGEILTMRHRNCLTDHIANVADTFVDDLKKIFCAWIRTIEFNKIEKKIKIVPDSKFINFNYTSTLEKVYKIDGSSIFYIHGNIDRDNDLIFGHRNLNIHRHKHNQDEGPLFDDAYDAATNLVTRLEKPVKEIIKQSASIFNSFKEINAIIIIGHSMSDIDLPYFEEIAHITKAKKWIISYYKKNEPVKQIKKLKKIGINTASINSCHITEINTYIKNILNKKLLD